MDAEVLTHVRVAVVAAYAAVGRGWTNLNLQGSPVDGRRRTAALIADRRLLQSEPVRVLLVMLLLLLEGVAGLLEVR